ncbi:ANM_HP_G0247970.mRNA.1.CDS.1 [Saccharomyces cerevisiae]|nr:ANM_HP_G0247970.mRNA.1.CDS.1 [Saccharomyces cerevisiae]CAI7005576.1 ANM_HP_G0247970.mRNA.1.CDS.1 [Saccharomyces cerevisiae]
MSVLTQRGLDYLKNTSVYKGRKMGSCTELKEMGYRMKMENTAIVCTGFTFFCAVRLFFGPVYQGLQIQYRVMYKMWLDAE